MTKEGKSRLFRSRTELWHSQLLFSYFQPVHCIVWAKDLAFMKLFGDKTQTSDLDVRVNNDDGLPSEESEVSFFEVLTGESSRAYAARIFDRLFGYNITTALENEDAWKERRKPCPLYLADIFQPGELDKDARKETEPDHEPGVISAMAGLGLKNPQEIWNVKTNANVFLESVRLYLERRNVVSMLLPRVSPSQRTRHS